MNFKQPVMTVLVNLTELNPPVNGGTWRVAQAVCQVLLAQPGIIPVFVVNGRFAPQFPAWVGQEDVQVIPHPVGTDAAAYRTLQPDLIVSPLFGMEPFHTLDVPHIAAVSDALVFDKPELFTPHQRHTRQARYAPFKQAQQLVTISEYSRGRLAHHLKLDAAQIKVVPHGADFNGDPEIMTLPEPYIFYPANTWPHKRHDLLFQIMRHVWHEHPNLNLVLTGGRTSPDDIPALVHQYDVPPARVHDLGYVSNGQLRTLYQNAALMLFTSAYEGFGMPVLEAMQEGCPVVCGQIASLPEIAGDAALYPQADTPEAWAEAVLQAMQPAQREALLAAGREQAARFTWAAAREQWAQIIHDNLPMTPAEKQATLESEIMRITTEQRARIAQQAPTLADLKPSLLKTQLETIEALRRAENRWTRLPVVGGVFKLMLRVRNLGRMWKAQSALYAALIAHLDEHPDKDK